MTTLIAQTIEYLERSQYEDFPYFLNVLGKEFIVFDGVFSPKYFSDSEVFTAHIPFKNDGKFLEIGSGIGVTSIFAAHHGMEVVSTDINSHAVLNTIKNAEHHGVSVDTRWGDLFQIINASEKFDQIYWNIPFMKSETLPKNILEHSIVDHKDLSKDLFLRDARNYLVPEGEIFLGFSPEFGDKENLVSILNKYDYDFKTLFQETKNISGVGTITLELLSIKVKSNFIS